MMNHIEVMSQAVHTLKSRGDQYGPVEISFDRISQLATVILNKPVNPYDVAMILHAVKLSRMQGDINNADHYVDGINYLAFAAQFALMKDVPEDDLDAGIAAIARKFSPAKDTGTGSNGSE